MNWGTASLCLLHVLFPGYKSLHVSVKKNLDERDKHGENEPHVYQLDVGSAKDRILDFKYWVLKKE